ncbi:MAG TPA: SAM-dependent chlorinase/fluorinase [Dehalococcoidia bacterium]|nr:SAM-dependent chlorinase/fluorinase [Dehalococcoidia bacterium]
MPSPIVGFTSDFGLRDHYVGTVKAVVLAACPGCAIVDVTHAIAPQNVAEAVFLTRQSWPYFLDGTIQLAVVDPGVGTARAAIALRTPRGYAVGPDNGVLSAALDPFLPAELVEPAAAPVAIDVPPGCEVRQIRSERVVRRNPSATFHGRDIFGPAAGVLAAGLPFAELGPARERVWYLPVARGEGTADGVRGAVLHVDRFGNLISAIRAADLPPGSSSVSAAGRRLPLVRTYGDQPDLCALIGSGGYLEIALPNGSAAAALNAGIGLEVTVPAP